MVSFPLATMTEGHLERHTLCLLQTEMPGDTHTVQQVTSSFESSRRANIEEKRRRRKNRGKTTSVTVETFCCSHCRRACLAVSRRPAADVHHPLPKSSLVKPSQERVYIYIQV